MPSLIQFRAYAASTCASLPGDMPAQCAAAVSRYFDEALDMAIAYLEDADAACVSLQLCAKKPCPMHAMMSSHALEHSVATAQRTAYGAAQLGSSEDDAPRAPRLNLMRDDGGDLFVVYTDGRSEDDSALRPEDSSAFSTSTVTWFSDIPLFLDWATSSSSSSSSSSSDAPRFRSSSEADSYYSDEVMPSSSSSSTSSSSSDEDAMPSSFSSSSSSDDVATMAQEASEVDVVFKVAGMDATGFLQSLKSLTTTRPRAFGPW
jgi:hypothetical protein